MELLSFSKTQIKIKFICKYFLFSTLFLTFSCYKVERNCSNFRFGTFKYERVIGNKLYTSFFIRDNDIEIEYYDNKIDTSKIRWVNECEFILRKKNPINNIEKKPISMKIVSTHKNYYIFEFSLVGDNKKRQRGKIVKISEDLNLPLKL